MKNILMADTLQTSNFETRLADRKYSEKECLAAIRGETVPHALGLPLHRLCTVRGIRYHPEFGHELRGVLPVFTRALNARSIMDNIIPNIQNPEEVPYCIWHPVTASEETYRKLAQRYPQMLYHIGRACAVAGYAQLYQELDILPDVHIAEEARECGNLVIFDAIVSQTIRYSIMNDYELLVSASNRCPAQLNGDTAVKWMLDIKQQFEDPYSRHSLAPGYHPRMFNITEDEHIDEFSSDLDNDRNLANRSDLRLLYEPLPADLPTVHKDILIAVAAYLGDVDRYVRLRRPKRIYGELAHCIRGIYHNTFFAVWWSRQPVIHYPIEAAINARFIMNNVLSRVPFSPNAIPYLIWWPTQAYETTYRHLAKVQPEMLPQIMRACIHIGYTDLFDELLAQITPDVILLREAEEQVNAYFRQALEDRVRSLGIVPQYPPIGEHWKLDITVWFGQSANNVNKYLDETNIGISFDAPYDGRQCDASEIELMISIPDSWKFAADEPCHTRIIDYVDWPKQHDAALSTCDHVAH